jgi:hypothetical protein
MARAISSEKLSDTLALTLCTDGYWLYDTTRSMNLSMRAKTERDALVEALTYYQRRLGEVEAEHTALDAKVTAFVDQFKEPEDD